MSKPMIAVPDWSDRATVTATSERAGFPATELLRMDPTDDWQADDLTGPVSLIFDRGDWQPFNFVALFHTNASELATWRIRADNLLSGPIDPNPVLDTHALGPCVRMDGTGSGSVGQGAWATATSFTMEVWATPAVIRTMGAIMRYGASARPCVRLRGDGRFELIDLNGAASIIGTTVAEAGKAYHLAATYDLATQTAKLIVNGVEEGSLSSVSWSLGFLLVIGSGLGDDWIGELNTPRLWNFARSAAQIAADAEALLTGAESGLLGAWPLLEGEGALAASSVAGGTAMVLAGGYAWRYGTHKSDGSGRLWSASDLHDHDLRDALWTPYRQGQAYSVGVVARRVQIDILDPANPEGVFRAGRAYISAAIPLPRNILEGSDFGAFRDLGQVDRTERGAPIIAPATIVPSPRWSLRQTDVAVVENLLRIFRTRGGTRDLAVVRNPEATTHGELGLLYALGSLQGRFAERHWSTFDGELAMQGF